MYIHKYIYIYTHTVHAYAFGGLLGKLSGSASEGLGGRRKEEEGRRKEEARPTTVNARRTEPGALTYCIYCTVNTVYTAYTVYTVCTVYTVYTACKHCTIHPHPYLCPRTSQHTHSSVHPHTHTADSAMRASTGPSKERRRPSAAEDPSHEARRRFGACAGP